MIYKLQRMGKEAAVAYFNALSRHSSGEIATEKNLGHNSRYFG
jgi:hypothetical protein